MKKYIVFLILILPYFSSCKVRENKHNNFFQVGIIIPLTGGLAEYGIAAKNGFELARKSSPESFKNIKFIYEDSQYNSKKSISAFQKLRNEDKVNLIYNWGTSPNEATIQLSKRHKIPTLAATVDDKIVSTCEFCIRTSPKSLDFAKLIDQYLIKNNLKKIAFLKNELTFFNIIIDNITSNITLVQTIPLNSLDLNSHISKLKNKEFDALGIFLVPSQVSLFYQKAKTNNLKSPTFGTDVFDDQNIVNKSSEFINGAAYPTLHVSNKFRKIYNNAFNNESQISFAGSAYDKANIIAKLFNSEKSKNLSNTEIMNKFTTISKIPGVTGQNSYKESQEFGKEITSKPILKIIKNKQIERY